jgi:transcription initiation factor TFIIH subunit 2
VLIVYGALLSSDPGDIHDTIESLITDRIRVSIIGLAAQVAICAELCSRTNDGSTEHYAVALHEQHLRELLLAATTPPLTRTVEQSLASLLLMGFPSRTVSDRDTISACTCHNRPCREGYVCTRCKAKVCRLPAECPVCGLTLVLSTHLARSYHHLFPLRNWVEVPWSEAGQSKACFACLSPFPAVETKEKGKAIPNGESGTANGDVDEVTPETKGLSESGRYKCEVCGHHFCIDCDVYAHEVIHNCPGCQSESGARPMVVEIPDGIEEVNGTNGNSHTNGDMVIDP